MEGNPLRLTAWTCSPLPSFLPSPHPGCSLTERASGEKEGRDAEEGRHSWSIPVRRETREKGGNATL